MRRDSEHADVSWHPQAVCKEEDDTLFYHPEGERGMARRRRAEAAKAICRSCPVMATCAADALARREPFGTWGGVSEDERAAILSGRDPRKVLPTFKRPVGITSLERTIDYIPRANTGHRIDSGPVGEHVMELMEAGYSVPEIALAAGLYPQSVRDLVQGGKTVTERVAKLLMAVQPEASEVAA